MVSAIEHSSVGRLQRMLSSMDVGDRVLTGRVEFFSCAGKPERKLSESLNDQLHMSPNWKRESPLGPLSQPGVKNMLLHLSDALGQAYFFFIKCQVIIQILNVHSQD